MWLPVDCENYVIKHEVIDGVYKFFLSNLISIWHCGMSKVEMFTLCKELNPLLEAPPEKVLDLCLSALLNTGVDKKITVEECSSDILQVKASGMFKNVQMRLNLKFVKGSEKMLFEELTESLLSVLTGLISKQVTMKSILRAKDEELEEYKLSCPPIKLNHKATLPYDDEELKKCLVPFNSVNDLFNVDLQELLRMVPKKQVEREEACEIKEVTEGVFEESKTDVKSHKRSQTGAVTLDLGYEKHKHFKHSSKLKL